MSAEKRSNMNMNKEKIKAIEEYLKYFPNEREARNNLLLFRYADELGVELKNSWYPRMEYGYFVINNQIKAGKNYRLTNSATHYQFNEENEDTIIIWSSSCGRLEFVDTKYWSAIDDEWEELMNVLKSYNPLDYDYMNDTYIFDLENGKKLIEDYDNLINAFKIKVKAKIKNVEIEEKKKQLAILQEELSQVNL